LGEAEGLEEWLCFGGEGGTAGLRQTQGGETLIGLRPPRPARTAHNSLPSSDASTACPAGQASLRSPTSIGHMAMVGNSWSAKTPRTLSRLKTAPHPDQSVVRPGPRLDHATVTDAGGDGDAPAKDTRTRNDDTRARSPFTLRRWWGTVGGEQLDSERRHTRLC
jgi:hypothetical protein